MKYIKPLFILGTAFAVLVASLTTHTDMKVHSETHCTVAFGGEDKPIVPINPYSTNPQING